MREVWGDGWEGVVSPKRARNERIVELSRRLKHKQIAEMFGISPARVSQIVRSRRRYVGPPAIRGTRDLLARIDNASETTESLLAEVSISMRTLRELHARLAAKIEEDFEVIDDEVSSLG